MVEYGIALEGTSGGAGGGGFGSWDMSYWAESIARDPTYLLIGGAVFGLIMLLLLVR
ncbi:hypothetical protein [Thalassovita aquimarina]|uniref:Uncharacterized protein n=1 Tax=Thalassovita aquimarina TaxID=2785917 RepID=A0ABS5HXH0_9RHOB|nr:hypothetical protein [Thalassovita aquimarina]MBR9653218.1 hypothetical protein [Thalassovita aquimarina]